MSDIKRNIRAAIREAKSIFDAFMSTGMSTHASSTAYYFFTAVIPVIIVYACIVSQSGVTEQDMVRIVDRIIPEALKGFCVMLIGEAYDNANLALSVSVITLLWTASQGISALMKGLNAAYGVEENRSIIKLFGISLVSVVAFILILSAAMYLVFVTGVAKIVASVIPEFMAPGMFSLLLRTLVLIAFVLVAFTLCYTYLPAGGRDYHKQIPGAVITVIGWFLFSLAFRIYISNSVRFTIIYGSLGTVVLFLFWLYWLIFILLFGGFFNRYRAQEGRGKKAAPTEPTLRMKRKRTR